MINQINRILIAMIVLTTVGIALMPVATATANWTFMVYLDGDNDLEEDGINDFLEMSSIGNTSEVNIIVQFDRIYSYDTSYGDWDTCKRFNVTKDMTPTVANATSDLGEINMATSENLSNFIEWGIDNYPADHYALILWNHGNGWKYQKSSIDPFKCIIIDETSGSANLSMEELKQALDTAKTNTGTTLDLIGFDACLMEMIEVSYQVRDYCNVTVGSQELEPGAGWPYDTLLYNLTTNPSMNVTELGNAIVFRYMESYGPSGSETQSAANQTELMDLVEAVDNFAHVLNDDLQTNSTKIEYARGKCEAYHDYEYVDLYHFAELINSSISNDTIQSAAIQVMDNVSNTITANGYGSSRPNSHGLSIYFPVESYLLSYDNIDFTNDTYWDEFLDNFSTFYIGQLYVNTTGWWREGGIFNTDQAPIQAAVNNAVDGDSVFVYNGTYHENVYVDKELTLQGEGADVVSVIANDSDCDVFYIDEEYVNISGFNVTGATGDDMAGFYLNDNADCCNIYDNIVSGNKYGIYLDYSWENTLTNNTVTFNSGTGIFLNDSSNNTITGNNASSNTNEGISLLNASNNTLSSNTANSNIGTGIWLVSLSNNTLTSNTASGNDYGVYLLCSSNNTLTSNTASENTNYGIFLWGSPNNNNTLTSNTASGNLIGICLKSSINNTLTNNNASGNDWSGIALDDSSNDNTLTNNTLSGNSNSDIFIGNSASTFTNNTLNSTTVSFTYSGNVSLKGVCAPAADPINRLNITKFINATNRGGNTWLFLNFSYLDSDVSGFSESNLTIWKHNDTGWSELSGTQLNTTTNIIGVNITSFSIFAPMAKLHPGPNITGFGPDSSNISDNEGATRTFNITVNQTVDINWKFDGVNVEPINSSKTKANYTKTNVQPGEWIVSAVAINPNGTDTQSWTWTVIENGTISGTVTDSSTEPINNANVYAMNVSTGALLGSDQTDSMGRYCISIIPGTYTLNVSASNYAWNNETTAVVNAGESNSSRDVELSPKKVTLVLKSGEMASGTAVVGNPTIFNLTATNYGTDAIFNVTNISANATATVKVNGNGSSVYYMVINGNKSNDFNVTINGTTGYYPVTIHIENTTQNKAANIDLYATILGTSGWVNQSSYLTGGGNATGGAVLVNSNVTTNATVNGSSLHNSTVSGNDTIVKGGSTITHGNVTDSATVAGGSVVKYSNVAGADSLVDIGSTIDNSTVDNSKIKSSTIVNVIASSTTITGVTIDTGAIELTDATVTNSNGDAQISGSTGAVVVTCNVNFTKVYSDIAIKELIIDQSSDTTTEANKSKSIDVVDNCLLTVNLSGDALVNISETGISPDGEGSDVDYSTVIGNFMHIQSNKTNSAEDKITVRLYYSTSNSYTNGVYIYYYNTDTNTWEKQTTTPGLLNGRKYLEATTNHLSTFVVMGVDNAPSTGSSSSRRSSSNYWRYHGTPTPTSTESEDTTVTPAKTEQGKVSTGTEQTQAAAIPTETDDGGIPGFGAIMFIAGLLTAAYIITRKRE